MGHLKTGPFVYYAQRCSQWHMRCTLKESSTLNMVFDATLFAQDFICFLNWFHFEKQPSRDALSRRCSENMQQIYGRTPIPKSDSNKLLCNFIELTLWHGCSPVNLLYIFRTTFTKNTSEWLLLHSLNAEMYFGPCQKLLLGLHHRCLKRS